MRQLPCLSLKGDIGLGLRYKLSPELTIEMRKMKSLKLKQKRINTPIYSFLAGLMALALASVPAFPQTGTGSVAGTVRDAVGAVIPGADVTITNIDTNVARKGISSEVGNYHIGGLPRGNYELTVELTGFKKWSGKIELQVGQNAVADPVLQVGSPQTVIEVSGAAPPVATESIDVSDVKDYQRIRQLPLNGRQISSLFNLTPGVEGGGNARVNGYKVGSLEITLDGISLVDRFGGGIARVQPGLDTIQEFRIETVGSDARFSRPATVTLATRSGTNQFHGSLFETHRNNGAGLLARRRDESAGSKPPQLIRNEFGASAGGPLLLGPLYNGHDKTFWFASYEGLRQLQQSFTIYTTTPTTAMWNGDLSNMVDTDGNRWTVYDPLTTTATGVRTPFPGNIIPSSRITAFGKLMQSLTALPTNGLNPHVGPNFEKFYPSKGDDDNLTFKGDHVLTAKDRLSVRWTRSTRHNIVEGGVYGAPVNAEAGVGTSRSDANVNNISINHTRTLSSNLLNELLVGVHRSYKSSGTTADFTDWPSKLGLPNPFGVTGWPTFYAYSGPTYFGFDSDNRKDEALTAGVIENHTTWNKGKHTIQFGGKFRKEWNNVRELQQAQGSHEFDGAWTSLYSADDDAAAAFTGSGFADMLLGLPSFLSNQYNRGFFYFRQTEASLYFNDRWKVTPRLTLTLGLRWDKWTPYREKFSRLAVPDIQSIATKFEVVTPGDHKIEDLPGVPPAVLQSWSLRGLKYTTADAAGMPSNLFSADNNNFGPRLGAAFKISNKMVLRGGYGEYFWTMPLSQILQSTRNNPPLNLRFTNQIYQKNAAFTYPLVTRPGPGDALGGITVSTQGIVPISANAASATVWDARNWGDGRGQSWHLSLEHEVLPETALRFSYIGGHGSNLEQQFELNAREAEYNYVTRTGLAPPSNRDLLRVNKDWGFIPLNRSGYSNTHSGQVEIERRFSKGLAFQWFYTFTRTLTTTDAGGFTSGNTGINSGGGGARVPENRQLWGTPNLSYDERLKFVYFNSTNVPPHRIRYNGIVDLPFGRGKALAGNAPGVVNAIIGGWQVATIGDWRSGMFSSVSAGLYQFGDPRLDEDQRPLLTFNGRRQRLWFRGSFDPTLATNVTGGNLQTLVPSDRSQRVLHQLGPNFNNQIPIRLANGTIRNTPIGELFNYSQRAYIIGPGAWNVDLALYKNFKIRERTEIRFSADFFNFFNHPNNLSPDGTTGLQDLTRQSNTPRTIQFSLRVDW